MALSASSQWFTTKTFTIFENTLHLNSLFILNEGGALELLVLTACLITWAKFLSHYYIAEAERGVCFSQSNNLQSSQLTFLVGNLYSMCDLELRQSKQSILVLPHLEWTVCPQSGSWIEEGNRWLTGALTWNLTSETYLCRGEKCCWLVPSNDTNAFNWELGRGILIFSATPNLSGASITLSCGEREGADMA